MRSLADIDDAIRAGRECTGWFRKAQNNTILATHWLDCTGFAGTPVAQFFFSDPLVGAVPPRRASIDYQNGLAPRVRVLTSFGMMIGASTQQQGVYKLLDYLLYYPGIDADDSSVQVLENPLTITRYAGEGRVRVMAVYQTPPTGSGSFTFNYLDRDGVEKTSPLVDCDASGFTIAAGNIVSGRLGRSPYLPLQAGDQVTALTSVVFPVPNGGLLALVLVREIDAVVMLEGSNIVERTFPKDAPPPVIPDNAWLGLICCPNGNFPGLGFPIQGWLTFAWSAE